MSISAQTTPFPYPHRIEAPGVMGVDPVRPRSRSIETVMLATDLGAASREATDRALELASRLGSRLVVVNVVDRRRIRGAGRHERVDQARAEREPLLLEIIRRARSMGVTAEFLLWDGDPGSAIVAAVEAESADVLVVGSHGRDLAGRILLGSISEQLVRTADCAVLVVRRDPAEPNAAAPWILQGHSAPDGPDDSGRSAPPTGRRRS